MSPQGSFTAFTTDTTTIDMLVPCDWPLPLAEEMVTSYAFPHDSVQESSDEAEVAEESPANQLSGFSEHNPHNSSLITTHRSLGALFSLGNPLSFMHDAFEHDPFQDSTFGYDHALPVDTYTVGNDNLDGVCHDHPGLSEDDLTLVTCTGTIAPSTLPAPTTLGFSSASNDPFGFSDWTYLGNPSPSAAGQYHLATDFSTLTQIPSASPSDHRTFPMGNAFQPIASAAPLNITAMSFGPGPVTGTIANEVRIPCTFAGCTRTFRRAGDCRRHMGKHQARAYNCIESECEKRFYRLDKLRDHLRQGHGITL